MMMMLEQIIYQDNEQKVFNSLNSINLINFIFVLLDVSDYLQTSKLCKVGRCNDHPTTKPSPQPDTPPSSSHS